MQVSALEAAGMIDIREGQKCWKGYEKKGTKMMFGKRYNNCVKKKTTSEGLMDDVTINPAKHQSKTQKIEKMSKTGGPEGEVAKKKLELAKSKQPNLPKLNDSYAPVIKGVMTLMGKKKKQEEKKNLIPKSLSHHM